MDEYVYIVDLMISTEGCCLVEFTQLSLASNNEIFIIIDLVEEQNRSRLHCIYYKF